MVVGVDRTFSGGFGSFTIAMLVVQDSTVLTVSPDSEGEDSAVEELFAEFLPEPDPELENELLFGGTEAVGDGPTGAAVEATDGVVGDGLTIGGLAVFCLEDCTTPHPIPATAARDTAPTIMATGDFIQQGF